MDPRTTTIPPCLPLGFSPLFVMWMLTKTGEKLGRVFGLNVAGSFSLSVILSHSPPWNGFVPFALVVVPGS